jgi:mannose-6-phosphate isomerase
MSTAVTEKPLVNAADAVLGDSVPEPLPTRPSASVATTLKSGTTPTFCNPLHPAVVPVVPAVKNYAWGILGSSSAVARLNSAATGAPIDALAPYAELWIGTHISTPCPVRTPEPGPPQSLLDFIQNQVILVDPDKVATYTSLHASGLPFLLKVLSVSKPLSIQAHPDLALAAKLHADAPGLYKDANHKPELTVALTPFEALCGFRPIVDIADDLARVPEFADAAQRFVADAFIRAVASPNPSPAEGPPGYAVSSPAAPVSITALSDLFASIMTRPAEDMCETIDRLVSRLAKTETSEITDRDRLLLHLHSEFPGDVGCFGAYLFSHIRLQPGESMFINANEPHAYLKGQCIEIMATSDNVVRAGLTAKHRDVGVLIEMLTYSDKALEISSGAKLSEYAVTYTPPVRDFMLVKYEIPVGVEYELETTLAPTVILVLGGEGLITVASFDDNGKETEEPKADSSSHMLPLTAGVVYYLQASRRHVVTSMGAFGFDSTGSTSPPLFFFRAGTNEAAISPDLRPSKRCAVM